MKRITTIFSLVLLCITVLHAQPSAVKKAAKNMFKITSFDNNGNIIHTGYGVFVNTDGTCLGNWNAFIGASSASVIDAQGRKYDVDCIVGANEIYNVVKFRVTVPDTKKMAIVPLPVATSTLSVSDNCWLVEYDVKSPSIKQFRPFKVETFSTSLPYYIFEQTTDEQYAGSPFLNENGELIGLMQPAKKRTDLYCPSAQYAMTMTAGGLTGNEPTLRQTQIRTSLPDDYQQAIVALMMTNSRTNSTNYLATANEFISRFPTTIDGYSAKAEYYIANNDFKSADDVMHDGIANVEAKDEAHFSLSKMIYNKILYSTDSTFTGWTLDKAIEEIDAAYAINPQPIYTLHRSKILYSQEKYAEAYDGFMSLSKTVLRSGENYYFASLCKQQLQAPDSIITQLLDSAIACYSKPYKADAATYLLIRGKWLDKIGLSRKALSDFNEYEQIMEGRINDEFYYTREQVELRARLYQLALNDINRALDINPKESVYYIEKALLLIRVNHLQEAITTSNECLIVSPDNADAYATLGYALSKSGKKSEGMEMLNKATSLGSELAPQLTKQLSK